MNFLVQFVTALIVGIAYYMLAMLMTIYDGIISMIFQPIAALIITTLAIGLMCLIGLPLRLSRHLRAWWTDHWWLSFFLGTVAFVMMVASWHPSLRIQVWNTDLESYQESFEPILALGGWLLTLFAVLHFFPPFPPFRFRRRNRAEN